MGQCYQCLTPLQKIRLKYGLLASFFPILCYTNCVCTSVCMGRLAKYNCDAFVGATQAPKKHWEASAGCAILHAATTVTGQPRRRVRDGSSPHLRMHSPCKYLVKAPAPHSKFRVAHGTAPDCRQFACRQPVARVLPRLRRTEQGFYKSLRGTRG